MNKTDVVSMVNIVNKQLSGINHLDFYKITPVKTNSSVRINNETYRIISDKKLLLIGDNGVVDFAEMLASDTVAANWKIVSEIVIELVENISDRLDYAKRAVTEYDRNMMIIKNIFIDNYKDDDLDVNEVWWLAKYGQTDIIKRKIKLSRFIGMTDTHKVTLMCYAAYYNDAELIEMLHNAGHCLNGISRRPGCGLDYDTFPIIEAVSENNLGALRMLVNLGADVNINASEKQGHDSKTPLSVAVFKGDSHFECARILLEAGATPEKDLFNISATPKIAELINSVIAR